ncbi:thiol peroxidase [Photobacterium kishitanii]|uniref:Thiol peroxidase n=1 Tax=Photobacterium kishitanii TaxID=318456 RepID=A0A0B7JI32_9GAMM|nr:thiol peroxidase [Photobacterium kishitanii]KJG08553.1 thiol peroxidase [Photobacterium kishitanii]OBU25812.1 lipid hydroperoxide peroxidase [Photobacterium kishitanii]OBU31367.1 lipid hydroperoxide peroxidase [Photobacterium kishitanii]PSU91523.1 thiol peroxidase [Photobacterium kishitanii]PSU93849.1 thiol peroxidase [Photobacterium kishitanii]
MSVTAEGKKVSISGSFPQSGQQAPEFTLCAADLSDLTLSSLKGKKVVLNIFPSVDTPTCAMSVRAFNKAAADVTNTVVVCISADLPFATSRFCAAEGIENVKTASFFRAPEFTQDYGVNINAGPLKGLAARAVIVINEDGQVIYSELVAEIKDEPNYEAAITALR